MIDLVSTIDDRLQTQTPGLAKIRTTEEFPSRSNHDQVFL